MIKLKTKPAIRRKKGWSCIGCYGMESRKICLNVSCDAEKQGLSPCSRGVVYVEDKENG